MSRTALVWFSHDLRLADHAPLSEAIAKYDAVLPVFVWSPETYGAWAPGSAQRSWLHHSLTHLRERLSAIGLPLVVRAGDLVPELVRLAQESGASAVHWHAHFEPDLRARDQALVLALEAAGVQPKRFEGRLLHHPARVKTGSGGPYQVYTPFRKSLELSLEPPAPLPAPMVAHAPDRIPPSLPMDVLGLKPAIAWDAGFYPRWAPGEMEAHRQLDRFLQRALADYDERRNLPSVEGTSRLSPHLHWGEISPRQVWHAVKAHKDGHTHGADVFLSEVLWREFSYHLLYHFPHTPEAPLREKYAAFPWRDAPDDLSAWQRGQTGYPIVDAGMRELWHTGWMHNRVRMIVASFLCKHLLLPWQDGARWFWDTLLDADLANNTMGWQWSAGSGADAQPYFRIFNPVTQSEKFDASGAYIRTWVPELKAIPPKYIHAPWDAPAEIFRASGVRLGHTYPRPLVDHKAGRARALDALAQIS